ncbi:hypothetical protein RM555_16415 [Micromonospora sp. DSM 115977]|uniref:Uncharacterized protein n=1 Tax=Micromonospora reichwaldensis TaxID=3075516 RepID=A0ABU2WXC2_9ACTN|nr:hypothetical protein [Micromonospora sp. DSM 115977]MDT0530578.1 hypothetical protein [Micromonospora sp. DSM 115977]
MTLTGSIPRDYRPSGRSCIPASRTATLEPASNAFAIAFSDRFPAAGGLVVVDPAAEAASACLNDAAIAGERPLIGPRK